jgi:arsenate reductase
MMMSQKILFLCPHAAAKSVIAKAYFNHIAQQLKLPFVADSAGTEPDEVVSQNVVNLLAEEGIDVSSHIPRLVSSDDLQTAKRIVSMGCTAQELNLDTNQLELWTDVPPVTEDPFNARDIIRSHVEQLLHELQQSN